MDNKTTRLTDVRNEMARHVEAMAAAKDNEARMRAIANALDVLLRTTEAHVRGNVVDL